MYSVIICVLLVIIPATLTLDNAPCDSMMQTYKSLCPGHRQDDDVCNQFEVQNLHNTKLDIIFVVDGSYSLRNYFTDIIRWVQNMADKFDVESELHQVGVVQYSSFANGIPLENQRYITTEISLGEYTQRESLKQAILGIKRKGLSTYTAHALNKTVVDFRRGPRWIDNDTSKVIVLVTDGEATDGQRLPETALYVRSLGIIIFAVGVGMYNPAELREIATGNVSLSNRVYELEGYSGLNSIVEELSQEIANPDYEDLKYCRIKRQKKCENINGLYYNDKCYAVEMLPNATFLNLFDAFMICENAGSVLGEIRTQDQLIAVKNFIPSTASYPRARIQVWLGMQYKPATSTVILRNGDELPITEFSWKYSHPLGNNPYLAMNIDVDVNHPVQLFNIPGDTLIEAAFCQKLL